jgi:hypothetical protein
LATDTLFNPKAQPSVVANGHYNIDKSSLTFIRNSANQCSSVLLLLRLK